MIYSFLVYSTTVILFVLNSRNFCYARLTKHFIPKENETHHTGHQNSKDHANDEDKETVVLNAKEKQTATIIFLHGNLFHNDAETGKNWSKILSNVQHPYTKIICPTVYSMSRSNPGLKDYRFWYFNDDLINGTRNNGGPTKFIHNILEQEIRNGIQSERIIIGGSAEGGVLAIKSAVSFPLRLAGIITLCSYLPHTMEICLEKDKIMENKNIPIWHCDRDPVSLYYHNFTLSYLKKISPNDVESHFYPNSKLLLPEEEILHFKQFFDAHLKPLNETTDYDI